MAASDHHKYDVDIPAEVEAGTYADFASIWHTNDSFVLDFAVFKRLPRPETSDDGGRVVNVPVKVVSRVRIPPSQVFEIMKGVERQLSMWERQKARRLGNRGEGGDADSDTPKSE